MASGAYTHTHTRIHSRTKDYKKPGAPATGRRAWFKNGWTKANKATVIITVMLEYYF